MKSIAIAASILFFQLTSLVISQQPARASIAGTVVRAGTGDPISGAVVTLTTSVGRPLSMSATADSQGRFELKDIDPGSYFVVFAANGYAKQEFGQRSFFGRGTPVIVAAGQAAKDINFAMTPAGNVSGHIRDSAGAPAVGIPVQLIRAGYSGAGQKSFQVIASERSNDRGEYRFYWLSPGRYYVSAGPSGRANSTLELNSSSPNRVDGEALAHTYYPGVTDDNQATVVNVGPGAEISGIDFSLVRQRFFRVRGRVFDSRTGAPPSAVTILPVYQRREELGSYRYDSIYNASSGTFELTNIAPGSYVIEAYLVNAEPSRRAIVPIEVTNQDVDGVVLTLATGAPVSGRIMAAGIAPSSISAIRPIIGTSANGKSFSDSGGIAYVPSPTINADGTFRIDLLFAGEYRLQVSGLPEGFYLKSARYNQDDILNNPWTYNRTESGMLEIELSSGAVQISGIAVDAQSRPVASAAVVLIPDRQRNRYELFKNTTADSGGRYSIRDIPPGDYRLYAWESVDVNAWFDPEFIKRVESQGKAIHLLESMNQIFDLKAISEN